MVGLMNCVLTASQIFAVKCQMAESLDFAIIAGRHWTGVKRTAHKRYRMHLVKERIRSEERRVGKECL